MIRRLLPASLALLLAACGASGAPSAAGPTSGGGGGGGGGASGLPAGVTLPPGAIPTTDVPATIDSCTLLSDEDIKAATSEGVTERKPSTLTQVFSSVCDVTLDGGGSLTVSILPSTGKQLWDDSFSPASGVNYVDESIPGLGDAAGRVGQDEIMVLLGDVLYDVQFIEFGRQDKLPVVRYLADIIAAKLPCLASGCAGMTLPPPPSGATATDMCTLLTDAEIKDATHYATTGHESATQTDCRWTLDTDSRFPGFHAIVLSMITSGGRQRFDIMADGMEHLPGVGDDAIKSGGNTSGSVLTVVGDRLVVLDYSLPDDTVDPFALVVPLLKDALARLPG